MTRPTDTPVTADAGKLGMTERDVVLDDIAAILRALDLGDHSRPRSAHDVVHEEILPEIAHLRSMFESAHKTAQAFGGCAGEAEAKLLEAGREITRLRAELAKRDKVVEIAAAVAAEVPPCAAGALEDALDELGIDWEALRP